MLAFWAPNWHWEGVTEHTAESRPPLNTHLLTVLVFLSKPKPLWINSFMLWISSGGLSLYIEVTLFHVPLNRGRGKQPFGHFHSYLTLWVLSVPILFSFCLLFWLLIFFFYFSFSFSFLFFFSFLFLFLFLCGDLAKQRFWGSDLSALSDFKDPESCELEDFCFLWQPWTTYCLVPFYSLNSDSSWDAHGQCQSLNFFWWSGNVCKRGHMICPCLAL